MSNHKTVVCQCGRQISTCRCAGPKAVVVSTEPCKHPVIGPSSISIAGGLTVASSAQAQNTGVPISQNHPSVAALNNNLDFYHRRMILFGKMLGVTVDPRLLTDQEWIAALSKFRRQEREIGAKQFAEAYAEELAGEPPHYREGMLGLEAHHAQGRDAERRAAIKFLREFITGKKKS